MNKACIIILLTLIYSGTAQAATYYQWVDDKGGTHFSATPPSGVDSSRVKSVNLKSGGISSSTPASAPATGSSGTEEPEQKAEKNEPAFEEQLANAEQTRKKNCDTAKDNKVQLTLKNRIRLLTSDGTYRTLSEEEKQQEIRMADEAIDTYCQ